MSEKSIIQLVPNKWVSEELLMAITGLTKHAIKSAREKSWMEWREYRHYSGDCQPKENSPILYNRYEVDNWVERQKLAIPRTKRSDG
ncbi:excisionase family protein [Salmonella enterica subsp. enterica serovar Typhimurium]|uniref:Excisionase family protein n=1 Tax=Salmonella enterica TaxID=28901 RepID=A0A754ALK0_SALER|nr:excisionase family protein [Salmonella enterica]EBX0144500.1 DNA-binding protein [Salmonella enterica subsp. enterica serovar Typhimurium]ECG0821193.1 DNA-binding protein [Salmonella enterica subsp. enterica]EHG3825741.1 excisionase family protein [Salmonella enterica subsp. enterica serovar 4,[5],12:i:-]EBZ8984683.1 DNA-binding protein [Salmonella enterica subsp. enterica serovar Typhimurium]ECF3454907.1 DNA-binding protein [Salmonella enterica subsp. enterica serovar Typhimurium]